MQTAYEIFHVPQDQIKCIHYTAALSHFILSKHKFFTTTCHRLVYQLKKKKKTPDD